MITGRATAEGTARYRERFPAAAAAGHFRTVGDLEVSSIGLGTYLGEPTDEVDRRYEAAVEEALAHGCNIFDTAINYRHQRSERALGRALGRAFEKGLARRDEVVICTKGGFLPFDGEEPEDGVAWLQERYVTTRLVTADELVAGCHSLAPTFLGDCLARSRRNLGVETIDLYYLHNPETQLAEVGREAFLDRLAAAFRTLEEERGADAVAGYGIATWSGLRVPPGSRGALVLEEVARLAGEGFVAVQAPANLAMPEALAAPTQPIEDVVVPLSVAARHLGVTWMASASILQGRIESAAAHVGEALGEGLTPAQRILQFTRSLPGLGVALVGMSSVEHVRENLALASRRLADPEAIQALFTH